MTDDPIACSALKCRAVDSQTIEWCEKEFHCAFAHQCRRELDRAERDRKDQRRQPQAPVAPEGD